MTMTALFALVAAVNVASASYGPPVAGVCVFSRADVQRQSEAGRAITQQMQQLVQAVQRELEPRRVAILNNERALQSRKSSLSAVQLKDAQGALVSQATELDGETRSRTGQLQRTRELAFNQLADAFAPILSASISAHRCGLVLDRGVLYGVNPAMDLTPEVVGELNKRVPSLTVSLAPPSSPPAPVSQAPPQH